MKLQSNEGTDSDARSPMAQLISLLTSLSLKKAILFHVTSGVNEALRLLRVANTERRQFNRRGTHLQNMQQMYSCHLQICKFVGRGAASFPVVRSIRSQHRTDMTYESYES